MKGEIESVAMCCGVIVLGAPVTLALIGFVGTMLGFWQ